MANGLLFASFDFTGAHEDEFHDWYDLEHIPERLRVPGFINAARWIGDENPKIAVATYDLANTGVLHSAPYNAIGGANSSVWTRRVTAMCHRLMRYDGEQLAPGNVAAPAGAAALLVATMNIDPAAEHEFNEWYNTEHLPQLAAVPGVLCARRFRAADTASERKYLALYHLNGTDVSRSAAWSKAADTEWTRRMRPHFRDMLVLRCKRYVRSKTSPAGAGEVETRSGEGEGDRLGTRPRCPSIRKQDRSSLTAAPSPSSADALSTSPAVAGEVLWEEHLPATGSRGKRGRGDDPIEQHKPHVLALQFS